MPLTGGTEGALPNSVVPQGTVPLTSIGADTLSPLKLAGFSTKTNKSGGGTQTPVMHQALDGQLEEIYTVLEEGMDSANCRSLLDGSYPFTFQDPALHLAECSSKSCDLRVLRVAVPMCPCVACSEYKKRKCTGGAIHIAALQSDGQLLEQLLDLRVDINVECRYMTFEKEGRAMPIHLAVQAHEGELGNSAVSCRVLKALSLTTCEDSAGLSGERSAADKCWRGRERSSQGGWFRSLLPSPRRHLLAPHSLRFHCENIFTPGDWVGNCRPSTHIAKCQRRLCSSAMSTWSSTCWRRLPASTR